VYTFFDQNVYHFKEMKVMPGGISMRLPRKHDCWYVCQTASPCSYGQ